MSQNDNENRVYGNRYEIKHKIARGGMADVFLATDRLLDRPVALKVLFPELSTDPSFVERFRREAQNAARLSHPNVVSVYDWGEDENVYYIVMEYIDGESLSSMIRSKGAFNASRAAAIGADVASALYFAHRNGVVHRDVKPGNVLIDKRGAVKVADFGIARARNASENLTQTGAVMGTATYFSPEQAQGMAVDERSDVYSLGVVLYEMVAGSAPFTGDNPVAIAYKHVREPAQSLREVNPEIASDYESIVAKAMAKAPSDRYQTADELRADLVRFNNGQNINAATGAVGEDATRAMGVAAPTAAASRAYREHSRPPAGAATTAKQNNGLRGPLLALLSLLAIGAIIALVLLTKNPLTTKTEAEKVQVPSVLGQPLADAQSRLQGVGLTTDVVREANDAAADTVLNQNPGPNTEAEKNSKVTLTVSSGPAPLTMADYTGKDAKTATATLKSLGLNVVTTQATSEQIEEGNVISQDPAVGQQVAKGARVTLTVSTGRQQVQVPDVTNATQPTAEQLLLDAGLRARVINVDSDNRAGTVVKTDPGAGTQVARGSTVTISVSNGPSSTTSSSTTTTTESDPEN